MWKNDEGYLILYRLISITWLIITINLRPNNPVINSDLKFGQSFWVPRLTLPPTPNNQRHELSGDRATGAVRQWHWRRALRRAPRTRGGRASLAALRRKHSSFSAVHCPELLYHALVPIHNFSTTYRTPTIICPRYVFCELPGPLSG